MDDMPLLAGIEAPDENLRENIAGSFAERIYYEPCTIQSAAISGTAVFHAESVIGRTVADRDYVDSVTQNISERIDRTDEKIRFTINQISCLIQMVDNLNREVNELRGVTRGVTE